MKRILLEIFSGLAVLVLLASFQSQISRMRQKETEVDALRALIHETVANLSTDEDERTSERVATIALLKGKIDTLEQRIAQANFSAKQADELRAELGASRRQATRYQEKLNERIQRNAETLQTYHQQLQSQSSEYSKSIAENRSDLALLAGHIAHDPSSLTSELLAPAVQLNGDDTVGSGTLIFSGKNPRNKKHETYVITSYHVVRNILADTPSAKRDGVAVTVYAADPTQSKPSEDFRGDMVAYDKRIDAALILLRSDRVFANVARVVSKKRASTVRVWDSICAIGCPLGNDPIPTNGEISSLRNELNGANYWMINAPTYFGNSGGGVYLADTNELVGVFSKIYTHGRGNPVVIPHMGLFTPMPLIFEWLANENLLFVTENAGRPMRKRQPRLDQLLMPAPR